MSARSCITDLRNPARWATADFIRDPFVWIVGTGTTPEEAAAMGGRVHIHVGPGILFNSQGLPAGAYNQALYDIAGTFGALTDLPMEPGGVDIRFLDLWARGVGAAIGRMLLRRFPFAQGLNLDYFNPQWMPAALWSGMLPRPVGPAVYWQRYNANICALIAVLREGRPGFVVTGQVDALPDDGTLNAQINGLYLEQRPDFNGRTLDFHAEQKRTLDSLHALARDGRESVWICELRDPPSLDLDYIKTVAAWAEAQGMLLSYGRGEYAKVLV